MRRLLFALVGLSLAAVSLASFGSSPASADIVPASAVRCVYAANHSHYLPHGDWNVLYAEPVQMGVGWVTDACWLQWAGPGAGVTCAFHAVTHVSGESAIGQPSC